MANDDVLETGSFPSGPGLKNLACNARDTSSIPGLGKSHMPQSNSICVPQLLSMRSRAHALQLEKACVQQWRPSAGKNWVNNNFLKKKLEISII